MRPVLLSVCVLTAACTGQVSDSPTAPASAVLAPAHAQRQGRVQLPFRGSLTTENITPPPNAAETAVGNATHLGRFTAAITAVVDLATSEATGTITFTAANGDRLFATFVGQGVFIPPNVAQLTEVATISGGTGRFEGATGTFTMLRVEIIDFATGRAPGYGSFDGHIDLKD